MTQAELEKALSEIAKDIPNNEYLSTFDQVKEVKFILAGKLYESGK